MLRIARLGRRLPRRGDIRVLVGLVARWLRMATVVVLTVIAVRRHIRFPSTNPSSRATAFSYAASRRGPCQALCPLAAVPVSSLPPVS